MPHRLRAVGLDFTGQAPVRLDFSERIAAPPGAVFGVLEDTASWPAWFGAVVRARALPDDRREVHLRGGGRFVERIVAARRAERFAYRAELTDVPGVRALLEDWRLEPDGDGGTLVRYTMAADGTAAFRGVLRSLGPGLGLSVRGAVRALDRRLTEAGGRW